MTKFTIKNDINFMKKHKTKFIKKMGKKLYNETVNSLIKYPEIYYNPRLNILGVYFPNRLIKVVEDGNIFMVLTKEWELI